MENQMVKSKQIAGVAMRISSPVTLHPLYATHRGILSRCCDTLNPARWNYGGRGIRVCSRWVEGEDGLTGFECFVSDMGPRPTPKHSVDRRDVNGHYEPNNCCWATKTEQASNRRRYGGIEVAGTIEAARAKAAREAYDLNVNVEALKRLGLYSYGMTELEMDRAMMALMWGSGKA